MSVALYRSGKDELVATIWALDEEQLALTCQACPAWSVKDVFAHHVHVCSAVVSGTRPEVMSSALSGSDAVAREAAGAVRDRWTQAGVDERRDRTVSELVDEWDVSASDMDESAAFITLDLAMHLFDIRETLGDESGRTSPLVLNALEGYYWFSLVPRLAHSALSVSIRGTEPDVLLETDGAPTVTGPTYDVLRSVGGRRTRAQADRLLDWGPTPNDTRDLFSLYGWPDDRDRT